MKFYRCISILPTLALALQLTSCHKDNTDPGNTPMGTLEFHLHTYINLNEVDAYNVVYTNDAGRKMSFSMAQLYLSHIQLVKEDGSLYTVPDTVVLKVLSQEAYVIAKVPAGNYKSVRFNVGLDSASNTRTPSLSVTDVLNHPEMWFSFAAQPDGYVFVNLQGKIDTTGDATAQEAEMQPFIYRIGTASHYVPVAMPNMPFSIIANQAQFVHMVIDYNQLFNGITLSNPANLHISSILDNSSAAATAVSNNIASMFMYE